MASLPRTWCLMAGLIALAAAGCSTTKEEPMGVTQLRDYTEPAAAVYLCDIVGRPAHPRLVIRSVWRHAAALGPIPKPGTPYDMLLNEGVRDPAITGVVVFVYQPPLPLLNDNSMPNRAVYVYGNEIPGFLTSVTDAEKLVRNTPGAARRAMQ